MNLLATPGHHLAAIVVLLAALFVPFGTQLTSEQALWDEATYFEAFEEVLADRSPYQVVGFYYQPVFAVTGAALLDAVGAETALYVMRGLNLVALAGVIWASLTVIPVTFGRRLLLGVAIVLLAPGVRLGVVTGNFSFLASALFLLGVLTGFKRPLAAGFLLGASILVKPLAVAALPTLLAHRGRPEPSLRQRAAFVIGGAVTAPMLLVGARYWPDFFALGSANLYEVYPMSRTTSLQRLLYSMGIDLSPTLVAVAVALLAVAVVRLRSWTPTGLMVVALTSATLAVPVLWNHTLLFTLPTQALAAWMAWCRLRDHSGASSPADARQRRLLIYEAIGVGLGILAIQLSDGIGAFQAHPSPQLILALLPPVLAPSLLAAYVVRRLDATDPC